MGRILRLCLIMGALVLVLAAAVSMGGCLSRDSSESELPTESAEGETSVPVIEEVQLVPSEAIGIRVFEERQRRLPDGNWETHRGPIREPGPNGVARVGYGDIIVELTLPPSAKERHVSSVVNPVPSGANVKWIRGTDKRQPVLQICWPGSEYRGIEPASPEKLPHEYLLSIPPGAHLSPTLSLQAGVELLIRRTSEPRYTIVEVGNESIRVPYHRPRRGYDLSRTRHTFELQFTEPMDMESVETVVEEQLGCTGLTDFTVVDAQTAQYTVMTEPQRSCTIDPEGAVDRQGTQVWFGMPLRFSIVPPVEVFGAGEEGESESIALIDPGRRIAAVLPEPNAVVGLETGYDDETNRPNLFLPWVYWLDVEANTVVGTEDLSEEIGFVYDVAVWKNRTAVVFQQAHRLVEYDLLQRRLTTLFEVPDRHRIYGFTISPNEQWVGVLHAALTTSSSRSLDLTVFSPHEPSDQPTTYDGVGNLSASDWMYGRQLEVVWLAGSKGAEVAFVTHLKEHSYLNLVDTQTGKTRLLMDNSALRTRPLKVVDKKSILGLKTSGAPVVVDTATGEEKEVPVDDGQKIDSVAVGASAVAFQVGESIETVDLHSGQSSTTDGQLVGWAEKGTTLLFYRWK